MCLKQVVEQRLLRLRRAGQSSANIAGAQNPRIPQAQEPASVSPLGVGPAACPLPGPQNDVKKARKKRQKREQKTTKKDKKKRPEKQKNS